MALQQADYQILMDLGLTFMQAKVYLALTKTKPAVVTVISKLTNISRPDVYRTISKLQSFGLVEEIIERPRRYRAIPPQEGLTFLLARRNEENYTLRKKTKLLLDKLKKNNSSTPLTASLNTFVLIPRKSRMINKIRSAIEESQRTINIILSLRRFLYGVQEIFAESHRIAWARGVELRAIIDKPEEATSAKFLAQLCRKNSLCEIRFLLDRPQAVIGIYDKKEAFIVLNPAEGLFNSPAIWSENPSFVTVIHDYFNHLWLKASKNSEV